MTFYKNKNPLEKNKAITRLSNRVTEALLGMHYSVTFYYVSTGF